MPPPTPPASEPLQARLMALAQTLQFGWFVGHLTLLFCTLRYSLSYVTFNYYSTWAQISYRLAFMAAAATYGIVVYKAQRARVRAGGRLPPFYVSLLTDENVQYLAMAFVWLYSRQVPLALLPFSVYSVFHIANYTRGNLVPTIQPPPAAATAGGASPGRAASRSSPLASNIEKFVKQYYDLSMTLVATLEIILWFRILLSAFTFSSGALTLLAIYTLFLRCRYTYSSFVQGAFTGFAARIDAVVANQSAPPAVRQGWETVKGLVRQAKDVTDLRKYGQPPQQAKKPQ